MIREVSFSVFFGLALSSCDKPLGFGPGGDDFIAPIAGNYIVCRTSAHQIAIVPAGGYPSGTPTIPTKVIECDSDGRFVIAKRQGLMRRNLFNGDTCEEPDPAVFDYWILDSKIPSVYGPLPREEFDRMKKSLGVPDSLSLRDVYDYREKAAEQSGPEYSVPSGTLPAGTGVSPPSGASGGQR